MRKRFFRCLFCLAAGISAGTVLAGTVRCPYTENVRQLPPQRGLMLGNDLSEKDYDDLADLGPTLVRYQMHCTAADGKKGIRSKWIDGDARASVSNYHAWIDSRLDYLERTLVPAARKHGFKISVDHQGSCGGRCHDVVCGELRLIFNRDAEQAFYDAWRRIATRCLPFRDAIYGYDLHNEPVQRKNPPEGHDYWTILSKAAAVVREVDPETPVILEVDEWDHPNNFSRIRPLGLTNVIYSVHLYQPGEYTHQGVRTDQGIVANEAQQFGKAWPRAATPHAPAWNREFLVNALKPVRDFQLAYGARIYVGEFSAASYAPGAENYLADALSVFEEYGWDWTYHCYREWGVFSLEHVRDPSGKIQDPKTGRPAVVFSHDNPRYRLFKRVLRGETPPLFGDGVRDDTEAIQARLDAGASLVYLPPPAKEYVISKTLRIGSGQELRLDRFSRIRLAPQSNCPMLENRDYRLGTNRLVAVTGGIWDCDNLRQEPNPFVTGKYPLTTCHRKDLFRHDFNTGVAIRFSGVERLTVRDLTIRNPTTFSVQIGRARYFTVENVFFDFTTGNPVKLNMDGIHIDSNSHFGRIAHIHGNTFDDMIALNTDECWDTGPISDIVIEDIQADDGFRAVRFLSKSPRSSVSRISVRGVRGGFYRDVFGFTRFDGRPDCPYGVCDAISIEDVAVEKRLPPAWRKGIDVSPVVWFEGRVQVRNLSIRNLFREERTWPKPTFHVQKGAVIENLSIRDSRMVNRLKMPIPFFVNDGGRLGAVETENVVFEGQWLKTGGVAGPTPTDVYLLAGQSNMAGRGKLFPTNRVDLTRVLKWDDKTARWVAAEEPIVSDRSFSGAGLAATFAREMADADLGAVIGLVPAAEGGSPLSRWEPGGDLYRRAVARTRVALTRGGTLKGILWHQGCADADKLVLATNYAARLSKTIAAFRSEFGTPNLPVVVGELGRYLKDFKQGCGEWQVVNEQIRSIAKEVPQTACVSSEGLVPNPDNLHFSTPSVRELGHRYAESLQRIAK